MLKAVVQLSLGLPNQNLKFFLEVMDINIHVGIRVH